MRMRMKAGPVIAAMSAATFAGGVLSTGELVSPVALTALAAGVAGLLLAARRRPAPPPRWVVVDGSNVMHWRDNTPDIAPVKAVVADLGRRGYTPGVVFDANAGYKLAGHYQHDQAFARLLGLPADRIFVVPKGTPADPYILATARDLGARIVSNDRYRDWWADYPEIAGGDHVIRGGWKDGRLWLDPGGVDA